MDETQIKHVIEAALLGAGRPLSFEKLASLFTTRASDLDKETLQSALDSLASDYKDRGLELKEVSSGYRIQIRSSMSDWLIPLWEERAPRYTRALLETLALIAYRQPITRPEIEEVRGVAVSTHIMRTLLERNWVRVVGHRDVPGKPAMFGTTRDFLDYFGLKKLEDLPALADVKDGLPELSPQTDLIDTLEDRLAAGAGSEADSGTDDDAGADGEVHVVIAQAAADFSDASGDPVAHVASEQSDVADELAAEPHDSDRDEAFEQDDFADSAAPEQDDLADDVAAEQYDLADDAAAGPHAPTERPGTDDDDLDEGARAFGFTRSESS